MEVNVEFGCSSEATWIKRLNLLHEQKKTFVFLPEFYSGYQHNDWISGSQYASAKGCVNAQYFWILSSYSSGLKSVWFDKLGT